MVKKSAWCNFFPYSWSKYDLMLVDY